MFTESLPIPSSITSTVRPHRTGLAAKSTSRSRRNAELHLHRSPQTRYVHDLQAPLAPCEASDECLMERIRSGDAGAVGILHRRYASTLKALIMRVLHNDAESDDILQEVFLEICDRASSYDSHKGKALGWIITLTRRRSIDRLRKREAYGRMEERYLVESRRSTQDIHAHVEDDVAHAEMREHLNKALALLPPAQRDVIEYAFYKGMSQREIAAHTGIPLGTIKTRIELAMKKITESMRGMRDLL
jgi:RNA polymerase sigma-70 factor (ECF subfamily)